MRQDASADMYTDETFLEELVVRASVRARGYWQVRGQGTQPALRPADGPLQARLEACLLPWRGRLAHLGLLPASGVARGGWHGAGVTRDGASA